MLPIARELNHFGDAMGRRRGVREPHVQRVRFDRPALAANTAIVEYHAIVREAQHTLVAQRVGSAIGVALVVTVQSQTKGINGFRNGWKVAICFALLSACVSLFQPGKAQQQPSPT